jgi:hypothetical protein
MFLHDLENRKPLVEDIWYRNLRDCDNIVELITVRLNFIYIVNNYLINCVSRQTQGSAS